MIKVTDHIFALSTNNTSYLFRLLPTGQLEHLYYGKSLWDKNLLTDEELKAEAEALSEKMEFPAGNMNSYDKEHRQISLEDLRLEYSSYGKGDIRDPFVKLIFPDGSRSVDFIYDNYEIFQEKKPLETLPGSYANPEDSLHGKVEELVIYLKERYHKLSLELHYYLYEECDVISRSARLINSSEEEIRLERLMSNQLDFETDGFIMTTFTGAWTREMEREDIPVKGARLVNASIAGVSSNRKNPFVMLYREETSENFGDCYGMNLIYSGNHYTSCEVNSYGKTRFLTGINPDGFSFLLKAGDSFEAPEAVMTYSDQGYLGMSQNMHSFVREHIVRGKWKKKARPILLNSWEAAYFKIDERKLLRLAKSAKEAGMELFVMDDGWFGNRNDDSSSLGDWEINRKKLPHGLKGLADRINTLGLDFGIWIEPEMINVDSQLYRQHPDWALQIPGREQSEGRNERFLDLTNPEVVDYITQKIKDVLSSANIAYVKWDMNRIMSDVYAPSLPAERQGEVFHRYILGFYQLAKNLTEAFPDILFEGCAAGGCRFDLGALCYFPQIWASDDTDAIERSRIQEGYSYGYPMSVLSAHVSSCPNHQTLRTTPLDTRFNIAAFGLLGYELNLPDLSKKELEAVKKQVALYKKWREVLQFGNFYRGRRDNLHEWTCVSKDKRKAVGMLLVEQGRPNHPFEQFKAKGLDEKKRYHFYSLEIKQDIRKFGDLVNSVSPVHVKPGSLLHQGLARFVEMPGETEEAIVSGRLLMQAGIKLSPAYAGSGYNEKTRYFADYSSRLYFMEALEETRDEIREDKDKSQNETAENLTEEKREEEG
jgi:alpha-galactosidase